MKYWMRIVTLVLFLFSLFVSTSLCFHSMSMSYNRLLCRTVIQKSLLRPTSVRPTVSLFQSFSSTASEDTIISRCENKISSVLKPLKLKVTSSNDDPNGSHIQVYCVSEAFEGKNIVQRQRLIYKAIWEELNGPVHAVDSIIAKTPKEAQL